MKVLAPRGGGDIGLWTAYNNDGGRDTENASAAANASKGTWANYTRTYNLPSRGDFSDIVLLDWGTNGLIDDVELWNYPDDGFIIRYGDETADGEMKRAASGTSFTFPGEDGVVWTDGAVNYNAGETVADASVLHGKTFCQNFVVTPVPAVKVDTVKGELVAFWNFDKSLSNDNPRIPTWRKYSQTQMNYDTKLSNFIAKGTSGYEYLESGAYYVSNNTFINNYGKQIPNGKQSITLKILAPAGGGDTSLVTAYNNAGGIDTEDASVASKANSNKGTWVKYTRTYNLPARGDFSDIVLMSWGSKVLIDDVELWNYPDDGFILRDGGMNDNGQMIRVAAGTSYTFPATTKGGIWTDGAVAYTSGATVADARVLHGKNFYQTDKLLPETPVPTAKVDDEKGVLIAFWNFGGTPGAQDTGATYKNNDYLREDAAYFYFSSGSGSTITTPSNFVVNGDTDGFSEADGYILTSNAWNMKSASQIYIFAKTDISAKYTYKVKTYAPTTETATTTLPFTLCEQNASGDGMIDDWDHTMAINTITGKGRWVTTEKSWNRNTLAGIRVADWGAPKVLMDDIEIWCYPDDGFIIKQSKTDTGEMKRVASGNTYTFETVSGMDGWTDGIDFYEAGAVVDASKLHGNSFYPINTADFGIVQNRDVPEAAVYSNKLGLRFKFSATIAQRNILDKLGFLVALKDTVTGELTHNTTASYIEDFVIDEINEVVYDITDSGFIYSVVVYGIPENQKDTDIVLRPFMQIKKSTGDYINVYGTEAVGNYETLTAQ